MRRLNWNIWFALAIVPALVLVAGMFLSAKETAATVATDQAQAVLQATADSDKEATLAAMIDVNPATINDAAGELNLAVLDDFERTANIANRGTDTAEIADNFGLKGYGLGDEIGGNDAAGIHVIARIDATGANTLVSNSVEKNTFATTNANFTLTTTNDLVKQGVDLFRDTTPARYFFTKN